MKQELCLILWGGGGGGGGELVSFDSTPRLGLPQLCISNHSATRNCGTSSAHSLSPLRQNKCESLRLQPREQNRHRNWVFTPCISDWLR